MENPFVVDRPVVGEEHCGRETLLERLFDAALRGEPAAAASRRGGGVTSLARELGRRLADEGLRPVLVDAAGCRSGSALIADARTVLDGEAGDAGAHLILDGLGRGGAVKELEDLEAAAGGQGPGVTALWQGAGGPGDGPLAPGDGLGPDGSGVGPVPLDAWLPHVLERFLETDRWIANEHVRWAVETTGGRPIHAGLLFHLLWEEAGEGGAVDDAALQRARHRLLVRAGIRFRLLLDPLTANQAHLLEALAVEEPPVRPFASSFVRRHGFASPSSVQRALASLRDEGLVDDGEQGPRPADPVLATWLARPRARRIEQAGPRGDRHNLHTGPTDRGPVPGEPW